MNKFLNSKNSIQYKNNYYNYGYAPFDVIQQQILHQFLTNDENVSNATAYVRACQGIKLSQSLSSYTAECATETAKHFIKSCIKDYEAIVGLLVTVLVLM